MLASALDGLRLSLHVLAATIWVGGQFTLAGLVPSLRLVGDQATLIAAKTFSKFSWPAYYVLVITGLWNVSVVHMSSTTTGWKIVLGIKIFVVGLSGLSAYLHTKAKSKKKVAFWGAVSGTSAAAAVVLGVFLDG